MHLATVDIDSPDVASAARFYADVLEQPVEHASEVATVRIGSSTLILRPGPATDGIHHLAFTIPANRITDAKAWLSGRVELLTKDGADEFPLGGVWNSESLYFPGPDGAILELIARHRLDNAVEHRFSGADLLCVSEIGLGVPDVPAAADALAARFGITRFGDGGREFSPVGDHGGLLILVSPDRPWFPSLDQSASRGRISVSLTDVKPGESLTPGTGQHVTSS